MSIRKSPRLTSHLPQWAGASALSALLLASTALPSAADEALADLVEEVAPSVVTILATQDAKPQPAGAQQFDRDGQPFGEFFRRFGAPDQMPRGQEGPRQGLGSGFILEADGLIVTNHHVVDGADTVTVRLSDDREFEAQVIGMDALTDLALLRIDAGETLPAVELGDSDVIRVGEDVVAVGNPFGLSSTVTTGIVSAKGRNISEGPYAEFLQTDAAINKGNSGGPLFNMQGDVVGVNSAIYSPTGGSVGLGFAVTSNIVDTIVADLKDDGQVNRGWLGVSIQNLNADIAAAMGLEGTKGALVSDIVPDSPSQGVLKPGDVIVAFNGTPVKSSADLPRLVGATKAGNDSRIEVFRNGRPETVTVTIGTFETAAAEVDTPMQSESSAKVLGVTVAPLTETARAEVGVDDTVSGVVVTSLSQDGPAAKAGLKVGDVIVKLGSEETKTPTALKKALKSEKTDPALVLINRSGNQIFVAVEIA
ncbi:serine protease [Phaeobacter gallaeciensis]|uniref:Probable periplasmic serine endoprotease DegP-like n=1 Tax=Phaeobacter gallaeciensis TaxID=60890 RepID=A0A366WUA4_9RHOB|nr:MULTISPECIES: Do family serine endopeptidase [Roseobacteraceae]MBT8170513.1 Do family serine endopeptidase [Falsiruegeria litorea]RBW52727.1 serine protease [Phaeobacter gallaeciensis]